MNRQERRRQKTKNSDRTVVIKQSVIDKLVKDTISETATNTLAKAVDDLMAAFVISLVDEFDFTTPDVERVLRRTNNNFDSILKGYLTLDDIKQWCDENNIPYKEVFKGGKNDNPSN